MVHNDYTAGTVTGTSHDGRAEKITNLLTYSGANYVEKGWRSAEFLGELRCKSDNKWDPNAIEVWVQNTQVGYVAKTINSNIWIEGKTYQRVKVLLVDNLDSNLQPGAKLNTHDLYRIYRINKPPIGA